MRAARRGYSRIHEPSGEALSVTDSVQLQPPSTNGAEADLDAVETTEWLEALDAVVWNDGPDRARQLLTRVVERAQHAGTGAIGSLNTAYVNTIPADARAAVPGRSAARAPAALDRPLERDRDGRARQQAVVRARRPHRQLPVAGRPVRGRLQPLLARARPTSRPGDLVYFQGHSSPGNYARAFLEGRLTERAARRLPSGGLRAGRPVLVPAPVADARLLAVPDRVARDRRDHLDLPGPLHEVPRARAG